MTTTKTPTPLDWRAEWDRRTAAFVDETWRAMMREPSRRRYAYYTPSAGATWGTLLAVREGEPAPEGAALVAAEPLVRGTRAEIARWLQRYAGQLPMLPTEGPYAEARGVRLANSKR